MRTRVGYNVAKAEILGIVEDMGEATTSDVAELTNRRYETAAMLMLQCARAQVV